MIAQYKIIMSLVSTWEMPLRKDTDHLISQNYDRDVIDYIANIYHRLALDVKR